MSQHIINGQAVDDTNPAIAYSGSWQVLTNSPQEFDGGVHSTTQTGASATITFTGTRIMMYCTVPMGSGSETVDMNFDGQTGSLSRGSHSDISYYQDNWFDSGPVSDSEHVLIVSNGGGASDTPFQLDYFSIQGLAATPSAPTPTPSPQAPPVQTIDRPAAPAAPASPTLTTSSGVTTSVAISGASSSTSSSASSSASSGASSASSISGSSPTLSASRSGAFLTGGSLVNFATETGATVTAVQTVTTTGANGSVITYITDAPAQASNLHNSSSKHLLGAIIGATIGGLLLILLLLLVFCLRRRRKQSRHVALLNDSENLDSRPRNMEAVIPFQLNANQSRASDSHSNITSALADVGLSPSYSATNARPFSEKIPDFLSNESPTSLVSSDSPFTPVVEPGPYRPYYLSDIPPSYQA